MVSVARVRKASIGVEGVTIYLFGSRSLGKTEYTGLIIDSSVRDWLWLGKVLAPLAHLT
jgi:hypothetical protein